MKKYWRNLKNRKILQQRKGIFRAFPSVYLGHFRHTFCIKRYYTSVPIPDKSISERQRGIVIVVQMQPLPQADRTVQRRNATRKSELFSGSPHKNVLEEKRKGVPDEENERGKGPKNIFRCKREFF
jgi:hypothetical protein